jgi:radical SAM superfamily enzyme YgiQ (UPF0313 family)
MTKILFAGARDPYSEIETRYPSLWPAYLAAMLEKHLPSESFEFHLVNGDYEEELKSFKPDIVAISSVTQNYNIAKEYAKIAKTMGLLVVIGGPHITALPECLSTDMDVACIGEGEEIFLDLVKLYLETESFPTEKLEQIKGIAYHKDGKVVIAPARLTCNSLDNIPHPKRSLIGYPKRSYILTSRGCPYRCVFCGCSRHWGKVRYASPGYIIEEIRELVENGVKVIRFNDDLLTFSKDRLKKVANLIIENGFHKKVRFSCWGRANTITPEIVDILKSMNVVAIALGLESGTDRVLSYLKGANVTVEDNYRALELLRNAGIQTSGNFIIGSPDETEEEILTTYNFIRKSKVDFVTLHVFSILPGTPVWDYALKRNLVSMDMDWSRLNFKFILGKEEAIVLSETLDFDDLHRLYKKFKRLAFFKALKALPRSPWIGELPILLWKNFIGKTARLVSQ